MQANKNHLITSRSVTFNVVFPCYQKLGQITHSDYNNLIFIMIRPTTDCKNGGLVVRTVASPAEDLVFKSSVSFAKLHLKFTASTI